MESIKLTSTDRQLLLYDIFRNCEQVSYEEITVRLPIGRKMIQRDIGTLTDAGLICVKYSRMATLMKELVTDSESYYEDDGDEYFSCKKCYYELFPDANEKMRQRDFAQLKKSDMASVMIIPTGGIKCGIMVRYGKILEFIRKMGY